MAKGPLNWFLRGWSLELKSLLLIGTALFISLCLASYAVQEVAKRLVMETTRQAARDYATSVVGWEHIGEWSTNPFSPDDETKIPIDETSQKNLISLRSELLSSPFKFDFMRLNTDGEFEDLGGAKPSTPREQKLLEQIEANYRKRLVEIQTSNANPDSTINTKSKDENREDLAFEMGDPNSENVVFEEAGPYDGFYYYYHPIPFRPLCLRCHPPKSSAVLTTTANSEQFAARSPFRVVRVKMPYEKTRVWTIWTFSMLIAIGLATLGITLFVLHWILKRLVINPLSHLRDVSDEISRGQMDRRAIIDTGDEFNELSEAFNRMLRHVTDSQTALHILNRQLDDRVDQLAQANLKLYEANRLKSEFLANMSHELRTPLNSILGFSEVLQSIESLSEKQRRYAANIQKSGRLLLEMINDILDLAKVEAGKMEVHPTHFDVASLIQGQCEVVRKLADDKNIDLQVETTTAELPVYQDQTKIQQILTNLLSNAIKFTPDGGLISVNYGDVGNRFFISVEDTGVGIAESDFEIIFEKFRQSSTTTDGDGMTREFSGTGLGLSIVRELCKLLEGDVNVCSELGKGSTFRVLLPIHFGSHPELALGSDTPVSNANFAD
jgi:two-component system, NarL family, sensor histidine kinase BarA